MKDLHSYLFFINKKKSKKDFYFYKKAVTLPMYIFHKSKVTFMLQKGGEGLVGEVYNHNSLNIF